MGFWKGLHNVVTLGGAARLDKARRRYTEGQTSYERTLKQLSKINEEIASIIARLRSSVSRTKRTLATAQSILTPSCVASDRKGSLGSCPDYEAGHSAQLAKQPQHELGAGSAELTLLGISAGTATAIAAWQGVQVLGIASTGTAIGGIYGAAASNAGWAAFGGGSLATGGGGMALGHLLLPGLGLGIMVGVSAISTHSQANELNKISDRLRAADQKNLSVLINTNSEASKLRRAEGLFIQADDRLVSSVRRAKRKLRRFGWLSILFRYIRFKFNGVYYTLDEMLYVQELDESVQSFMNTFGVQG